MITDIVFDFREYIFRSINKDQIISNFGCKAYLIPKNTLQYPHIIFYIEKYHKKNNNPKIIFVEGIISVFSRDRSQSQVVDIMKRIEKILIGSLYINSKCRLVSLNLDDYNWKISEDGITIRLSSKIYIQMMII